MPNFSTGPSLLPDVGELTYNGCTFSPLFVTTVSGTPTKDEAGRNVKYMDYSLEADGYVTLPDRAADINGNMNTLRRLLTAQAGTLIYRGRGFDLQVNLPNAPPQQRDVAWGPVPELLEFNPLGAGRSAKVKWKVRTRVPEVTAGFLRRLLLQLNYETSVTYGEDGYSSLSARGTLEIPLTRPTQATRTLTTTVDDFRFALEGRILEKIDLSRFRVTRREIKISRDKRTMEWDFAVEEKPWMDLPPLCTLARGTFSVRPDSGGKGGIKALIKWFCTLKATYTVRKDAPRRTAWVVFLSLLRLRMNESLQGVIPQLAGGNQNPAAPQFNPAIGFLGPAIPFAAFGILGAVVAGPAQPNAALSKRPFLVDFSFEEGLYLDSKTTTFSATWWITTALSNILAASGLWRKDMEVDPAGRNLWAISARNISLNRSWLPNQLDPAADVIVDFGSTD